MWNRSKILVFSSTRAAYSGNLTVERARSTWECIERLRTRRRTFVYRIILVTPIAFDRTVFTTAKDAFAWHGSGVKNFSLVSYTNARARVAMRSHMADRSLSFCTPCLTCQGARTQLIRRFHASNLENFPNSEFFHHSYSLERIIGSRSVLSSSHRGGERQWDILI